MRQLRLDQQAVDQHQAIEKIEADEMEFQKSINNHFAATPRPGTSLHLNLMPVSEAGQTVRCPVAIRQLRRL